MRVTRSAVIAAAILVIAAANAHAAVFADDATLNWSIRADLQDLDNSAGGTDEPDDSRTSIKQDGGTVTLVSITWDFPELSLTTGSYLAYLIVDSDIKGTVRARVTAVNGDTDYSGAWTTLAGTGNANTYYSVPYSLTAAEDVTSVTMVIVLSDSARAGQILIDAVALPEPGTWLLFGLGATGLVAWRRRQKRRST